MATEKLSTNSYRHVLKYTGIFGGVQVFNILVGLVRNKFVAILLGPEGMGLVSLLNTAMNFISQSTSLGVSFSAIRRISELYESGDRIALERYIGIVRLWSVIAAVLGAMVCVAAGPLLNVLSFSWGDHTLHFILLAPAVAMTALAGSELAILKGTQRLRQIASIQALTSVLSLAVAIPLFITFNYKAIVPVISLTALVNLLPPLVVSNRNYPFHLSFSRTLFAEGSPMVRMGLAFTLAAMFTSGTDMLVRALLNQVSDLNTVGLYNAAYMITITYSSMVFSAMESDYFPRLSAINHDNDAVNSVVNRQMEVSLIVISPMLACLMVFLPFFVPLLFSGKFLPVVGMAQVAALAMFFKAMSLPMAYVNLAKGNSRVYLLFEAFYAVAFVLLVVSAFSAYGLIGAGYAIVIAHVAELMVIYAYLRLRHGFRFSSSSLRLSLFQLPLLLAVYCITVTTSGILYWTAGITLTVLAIGYSLRQLQNMRKT